MKLVLREYKINFSDAPEGDKKKITDLKGRFFLILLSARLILTIRKYFFNFPTY